MAAKQGLDELGKDAAFAAMLDDKWAKQEQVVARNRLDSAALRAELARAGFPVETISELYQLGYDYRPAIPILIKWLTRLTNLDVKQAIIRALTDKWARPAAAKPLIDEFRRAPLELTPRILHYKWTIGNALRVVADDSVFEEIIELLRDQRHSWSRDMLPLALQRMKDARAVGVLMEALERNPRGPDREGGAGLAIACIRALGNKKVLQANAVIEEFLSHANKDVREEAERSLSKNRQGASWGEYSVASRTGYLKQPFNRRSTRTARVLSRDQVVLLLGDGTPLARYLDRAKNRANHTDPGATPPCAGRRLFERRHRNVPAIMGPMRMPPNEPILDGVDARVKSREIVDPSQHLSITRKHLVGQEVKGKRLKSFVVVESHLEGCQFDNIRSDYACFGAGRTPSTFIECSFRNVRLRSITAGIARFERCRFERIDFREMLCFAVDFVDCTFRGKIAKAVIAAHPMGGHTP